jgi:glutamine synthetase
MSKTIDLIKEHEAKWIDLRFTDSRGKEQHVTLPASEVNEDFFADGKMFDGSSIAGWKGINESDMILMPDDTTAVLDPFTEETTVNITCDIVEPSTMQGYERDPRSVARRAEEYLKSTGIADSALFGPEPEFFVFDSVKWSVDMKGAMYELHSEEAAWVSGEDFDRNNIGHRPGVKGGYFPVPPVDSLHDLRGAMCAAMESMGLNIEVHHHEVGTAGQCEIGVGANTLTRKADEVQILKYCVHNVAHAYGKTATFMPKPVVGDNGSGMHVHQSLSKDGKNIFAGDGYAGLSEIALYYIGGIIKHAKTINAFTNASTNSYKRLVPGFEAPVMLAYSANPYLAFAAMLMAGLDGIQNKIHPGDAMDKDLYDLPKEEAANIPTVAATLQEALDCLEQNHEFLTRGGVFTEDMIAGYIDLKRAEVERLNMTTHPVEFELYYSC